MYGEEPTSDQRTWECMMSRRLPEGRELDIKRTQQGLSLAEIAAQYGVTRQAVHKAHLRWQMQSLPPGADLHRMIEQGWTWEALAIQYNTTPDLAEHKHRMWDQRRRQRERQRQAS